MESGSDYTKFGLEVHCFACACRSTIESSNMIHLCSAQVHAHWLCRGHSLPQSQQIESSEGHFISQRQYEFEALIDAQYSSFWWWETMHLDVGHPTQRQIDKLNDIFLGYSLDSRGFHVTTMLASMAWLDLMWNVRWHRLWAPEGQVGGHGTLGLSFF